MSEEFLKNRDFVVPGDEILKSMDYLPGRNTYREGESIHAKKLGLTSVSGRVVSVIPLNSVYIPKAGDMVVARVIDIQSNGWVLYVSPICNAFLSLSGVRQYIDTNRMSLASVYSINNLLYTNISAVNQLDSVYVTMQDPKARKLDDGRLININPAKIPRIIGKEGSMITMIKNKSGCRICIGQNGIVWIQGREAEAVIEILRLIESQPYAEGLTDKVAKMLDNMKAEEIKDDYGDES
ncbi:MAG: hypothetical protein HYX24_00840 [Candidatus Aenigmarchaeota archaeon]|nr:hypothetical protein [Candidatus Aenigmarchaeota archaeon]